MKISEILFKAADLIEPEGAWIQNAAALDANDCEVDPDWPEATCFCLEGAYVRSGGRWNDRGWSFLRDMLGDGPIGWNDAPDRTQAEVVAKLREAAAKAQEQGL